MLAHIKNKRFDFAGVMWGTSVMYLYENGGVRSIVSGVRLNHYNYSNGMLSVISDVDFDDFKDNQKSEYMDTVISDNGLEVSDDSQALDYEDILAMFPDADSLDDALELAKNCFIK